MYERKTCRLCDEPVKPVFKLTPTPIANNLKPYPDSNAVRYPLELTQCTGCSHVQQRFVVDAQTLYTDYKYSTPDAVRPYLEEAAKDLRERFPQAETVLEIGSNNGLNLDVLCEQGFTAWGIDPCDGGHYFTSTTFGEEFYGTQSIILANHVFAHIDDLQDVFKGIDKLLAPEGAVVFEVQYLPDLIAHVNFDMIYHEHLDHHTIAPLAKFLKRFNLVMTSVERTPRQGGSIRVTAERKGVEGAIPEESVDWADFSKKVEARKVSLKARLGKTKLAAFGAAAKACTLINHFEIADNISVCIDDTPLKWGHYIPGTDIPIVQDAPGPVLLTAWNYDVKGRFEVF